LVNQCQFPKEFRIEERPLLQRRDLERIVRLLESLAATPGDEVLLVRVATSWWELSRHASRIADSAQDPQIRGRARRMSSVLTMLKEAMDESSLEAVDDEGQNWVEGSHWEVIDGEIDINLTAPTIVATLAPAVRYKGYIIERGKVLVNHPQGG
jgi:hypothetical protein